MATDGNMATPWRQQQQFIIHNKMADRENGAQLYLTKHRIPDLLHNITSGLVYDRPGIR